MTTWSAPGDRRSRVWLRAGSRLAIPPLGVSLAVLGGFAWLSGLLYLVVRAGWPTPLGLAVVDGLHVYVGVASVVFLGAKVWRVGFRRDVAGVRRPETWHRWLSWSMVALYLGVYVTGGLALLPLPAPTRTQLVDAHLIASVWAAVPTTWHVWYHRHLATPYLRHLRRPPALRLWVAVAVVAIPVAIAAAVPRAAGQLSALGAGGTWQSAGPQTFLDRMEVAPDGRTVVAGGHGLYTGDLVTGAWRRLTAFPARDDVLGLALPHGGHAAVYVGTVGGLYAAPTLDGPYRLVLSAREVHGIAVDPAHPRTVWATSRTGVWRSTDAGAHWQQENAGLADPTSTWPIAYRDADVYLGTVDAIYRWAGVRWERDVDLPYVASFTLAPGGRLFAASMGGGIRMFDGSRWLDGNAGLASHGHAAGTEAIHVVTVTALSNGTAYAGTMLDGIDVSRDGGRSWAPVWTGLSSRGDIWRIVASGDLLVIATDRGIATYRLPASVPPDAAWWIGLVAGTIAAALVAVALAAWPRRPTERVTVDGHAAAEPVAAGSRGGT